MRATRNARRARGIRWGVGLLLVAVAIVLWTTYAPGSSPGPASATTPSGPPWRYGASNTRFTIELYADFECPYCRQFVPGFLRWVDRQQDVAVEWRHLPLSIHDPVATDQAVIAECAGRRGGQAAFWAAVRTLYQRGPNQSSTARPYADLSSCFTNEGVRTAVRADAQAAAAAGITGTPALRMHDTRTGRQLMLYGVVDESGLLSALDAVSAR